MAIDLLVTHINKQLDTRSLRFRNMLSRMGDKDGEKDADHNDPSQGLVLLQQTNQLLVGLRGQLISMMMKLIR